MEPEESVLFFRRWMYEKEPELSEGAIKYHKVMSIASIVIVTIIILFIII